MELPSDGGFGMSRRPWVLSRPGSLREASVVELEAGEALHLRKVLRRKAGDLVFVADGCGHVAEGRIRELIRVRARIELEKVESFPRNEGVELLLGMLHGRAMDFAIQKAVELGVRRLIPISFSRSQAADGLGGRLEHWRKLARQAIKQCRRPWEMEMMAPLSLGEIPELGSLAGFFADPAGRRLGEFGDLPAPRVLIGPEGGMETSEKEKLEKAGWLRLSLGTNVLRAETAAVAAVVLLENRFFAYNSAYDD